MPFLYDCMLSQNISQDSVLRMPMETLYENSVSLKQGNLNQFNVSVLRIPMDKTVFH